MRGKTDAKLSDKVDVTHDAKGVDVVAVTDDRSEVADIADGTSFGAFADVTDDTDVAGVADMAKLVNDRVSRVSRFSCLSNDVSVTSAAKYLVIIFNPTRFVSFSSFSSSSPSFLSSSFPLSLLLNPALTRP